MGVPVGGKGQCHGVFGNCFRRITGNTCHLDSTFCCSFQINIIVSGTAHQDQFYTLAVKFFNDRCAEICIYKCTDGIVAVGKSCGFFMDICFNEFNFNTWIRWKQLLKKFPIVALGVIKQNFHNRCSSLEIIIFRKNNTIIVGIWKVGKAIKFIKKMVLFWNYDIHNK